MAAVNELITLIATRFDLSDKSVRLAWQALTEIGMRRAPGHKRAGPPVLPAEAAGLVLSAMIPKPISKTAETFMPYASLMADGAIEQMYFDGGVLNLPQHFTLFQFMTKLIEYGPLLDMTKININAFRLQITAKGPTTGARAMIKLHDRQQVIHFSETGYDRPALAGDTVQREVRISDEFLLDVARIVHRYIPYELQQEAYLIPATESFQALMARSA